MYNVVFRRKDGSHQGVITWTSYPSKAAWEKDREHPNIKAWYDIVAEGVTEAEAIDLCSSIEATMAVLATNRRDPMSALCHPDEFLFEKLRGSGNPLLN